MYKKDIPSFRKSLLAWYDKSQRKLPWRETKNPYLIWVSEIMLQQTQVKTVLPYYQEFCQQFPDVQTLASASQQTVLKLWEGLGYYARARNMHRSAKLICEKYDGKIPEEPDQIKQLPGVGDYIAAAVLSIAYQKIMAVTDGNVKRVISRLYCLDMPVNASSSYARYQRTAGMLIDSSRPGDFNQAMMELGALICVPKAPVCDLCPVHSLCRAFKTGKSHAFPKREKRRPSPEYRIAVGVVVKADQVLIVQRDNNGLLGGLWEFPGGKIKPREKKEKACVREIKEKVNLTVDVASYLTRAKHAYTHFKISMDVFLCRYVKGGVKLNGPADYRWVNPNEIVRYPFHKANLKFIPFLREKLQNP